MTTNLPSKISEILTTEGYFLSQGNKYKGGIYRRVVDQLLALFEGFGEKQIANAQKFCDEAGFDYRATELLIKDMRAKLAKVMEGK